MGKSSEELLSASVSRRLGEDWTVELDGDLHYMTATHRNGVAAVAWAETGAMRQIESLARNLGEQLTIHTGGHQLKTWVAFRDMLTGLEAGRGE